VFARDLRLHLAREHLDRDATGDGADESDLLDPIGAFAAFRDSARRLQQWHEDGRTGPRPPGRLRPYAAARLTRATLAWATPLYRIVADPDARPALRRADQFLTPPHRPTAGPAPVRHRGSGGGRAASRRAWVGVARMRDRGYPTGEFDRRVQTLSVEYARTEHYRRARPLAGQPARPAPGS
jgi:hypothetical protein